jgi:hypothetical protein
VQVYAQSGSAKDRIHAPHKTIKYMKAEHVAAKLGQPIVVCRKDMQPFARGRSAGKGQQKGAKETSQPFRFRSIRGKYFSNLALGGENGRQKRLQPGC